MEYKKFKDASAQLQVLELRQESVFPRTPPKPEFEAEPVQGAEASIFDLVNAVSAILQRVSKREDQRDIFEDKFSVSQKIEHLMMSIRQRPRLRFSDLFEGVTSRSEVVCTFLALIELIRLRQVVAVQAEAFGEIEIERAEPVAAVPAAGGTEPGPTAAAATEHSPAGLLGAVVAGSEEGDDVFVLPTYKAMLDLRAELVRNSATSPYWGRAR